VLCLGYLVDYNEIANGQHFNVHYLSLAVLPMNRYTMYHIWGRIVLGALCQQRISCLSTSTGALSPFQRDFNGV